MKRLLLIIVLFSTAAHGQEKKPFHKDGISTRVQQPQHDPPLVINTYSEVIALNTCKNEVTVTDPSVYRPGDTVLIIQMKGAIVDTSNTATYGTIINYQNAGNYEMNYINTITGNRITLKNKLIRQYDVPNGMVQLIGVPYIKNTNYNGPFTCLPWDGSNGGVMVLNTLNTNLLDDIDVSGRGFRSGEFIPSTSATCFANNYNYPLSNTAAAQKGESITTVSVNTMNGKGSPAGGGGGGLGQNSGGGGGGNGGVGGYGGYQSESCGSSPFDNRGIGGKNLNYSSSLNKIYMGGGGGAGHTEELSTGTAFDGRGGGIAIIIANTITSNFLKIISNGGDGTICNIANCNNGMGGAGAGGTVLLYVNQIIDNVSIETKGGKGSDMDGMLLPDGKAGPGGGGGGGVFFLNRPSLPGNVSVVSSGGMNGVITGAANEPWGATAGTDGLVLFDLPNPILSTIPFQASIDSVRINSSDSCNIFDFSGEALTNSNPVLSWNWNFGDGITASIQDISHIYTTTDFFNVHLIATAVDGCKDSISTIVNPTGVPVLRISKSNDINCNVPFTKLKVTGALHYQWSPSNTLSSVEVDNPIANPGVTTTYFVTGSNNNNCSAKDSITIVADFSVGNVLLPTSFTPNADGLNDCFGIRYYREIQNLTFIIYNRFGEKVFDTKNAAECWDGKYKGQPVDPGNYVYYLSAKTLCGDIVKKGQYCSNAIVFNAYDEIAATRCTASLLYIPKSTRYNKLFYGKNRQLYL